MGTTHPVTLALVLALLASAPVAAGDARAAAASDFEAVVLPLVQRYCLGCHSTEEQEGDLDLERFTRADQARSALRAWRRVAEGVAAGEMPPPAAKQPNAAELAGLRRSVRDFLAVEAAHRAGDPGRVVLRRLDHAEYTYTLRDLTGVATLEPAREFPVDGAAGEGFTNTGQALVMSPSLVTKYLDAAKQVAEHAVLLPDGFRFAPQTTSRDWTEATLAEIRAFYREFTDPRAGGQAVNLQGIVFDTNGGGRLPLDRYLAATLAERGNLASGAKAIADLARERGLNARYLGLLWAKLTDPAPSALIGAVQARWRAATEADVPTLVAEIAARQNQLWRFSPVGHIGKRNGPQAWMEPVDPSPPPAADRAALDDFRALFPPALCYAKIVPVDEVVTLTLFHREDEPLVRLMLDDGQKAHLDRLWDELHFLSRDALTLVDAYAQLLEYASQDGDPKVFEPLRQPILDRAAAFRRRLVEAEPRQVAALVAFADRAYRRPLTASEADQIRGLYDRLRGQDVPHDEALRLTLARILVAPAFLYRVERPGSGAEPGPVTPHELATRLSFFLWSAGPDAELRALADSGRLAAPEVLAAQTRRLLGDAKIRRLATEFAARWLQIADFDHHDEKSERHFPTFLGLRGAMHEESIRFLTDLLQRDGSVLDLLDADHTFLNGPLAEHYGIPLDPGSPDAWRRVDGIKRHGRGGILGQASTLAAHSGASRTSPTLRGNWISEVLLGERLPRPPKGVAQLPEDEASTAGRTVRQLVEQHASDAKCAGCHARIDPLGFALERFDAIGRRRDQDFGGRAIATDARARDGAEFAELAGLRDYLLARRHEAFVQQFCRKLLGFALGRSTELADDPLLAEMQGALQANGFRVGSAVEVIVRSRQFREIRGRETAFTD